MEGKVIVQEHASRQGTESLGESKIVMLSRVEAEILRVERDPGSLSQMIPPGLLRS